MQINIEEKYKEIKKDIMDNISEVFNREHYYSHKYRGDIDNDINVAVTSEDSSDSTIQIFVRNKTGYIKDIITVTPSKEISSNYTSKYND